jgi:hypothetical protein
VTEAHTLGELISVIYEELLTLLGDEDAAAVATAAAINDLLTTTQENRHD